MLVGVSLNDMGQVLVQKLPYSSHDKTFIRKIYPLISFYSCGTSNHGIDLHHESRVLGYTDRIIGEEELLHTLLRVAKSISNLFSHFS